MQYFCGLFYENPFLHILLDDVVDASSTSCLQKSVIDVLHLSSMAFQNIVSRAHSTMMSRVLSSLCNLLPSMSFNIQNIQTRIRWRNLVNTYLENAISTIFYLTNLKSKKVQCFDNFCHNILYQFLYIQIMVKLTGIILLTFSSVQKF